MKAGTAPIFVSLFLAGAGLCVGLRHQPDAEKHKPPQEEASERPPAEAVELAAMDLGHSKPHKPKLGPPEEGMVRNYNPGGPRWIHRWDRIALSGGNDSEPFETAYHYDDWVSTEQLHYVNLSRPPCVRPVGHGKKTCMLLSHGICLPHSKGVSSLKGGYEKCMEPRKTCAVVGSSHHLLDVSLGRYIDSHDVVIRINSAPAGTMSPPTPPPDVEPEFSPEFLKDLVKHVGTRTDVRFVNHYGIVPEAEGVGEHQCLFLHEPKIPEPCGWSCSRNAGLCNITCGKYGPYGCTKKAKHCDLKEFKCMGSEMEEERDWGNRTVFLENYFGMIADQVVPHATAGFKALMYAMNRCEKVTVLGFGPSCHHEEAGARYYEGNVGIFSWHHYSEEFMLLKRAAERGTKVLLHPDVRKAISTVKKLEVRLPQCVEEHHGRHISQLLEGVHPDGAVSLVREPLAKGTETI